MEDLFWIGVSLLCFGLAALFLVKGQQRKSDGG
jgi:hypothetical protein